MKKILIADDHQVVRRGLKMILSDEFNEVEFEEAENSAEVFQKILKKKWDLLILDINMPGRNGLDVMKQIKTEKIKVPVLMLSMHPEEQIAVRALRAGAMGYLSKDTADTELLNAVRQILSGKKYITPAVAEQLAEQLSVNPEGKEPHELLSDREYETLLLIATGKSVSEIAEKLSLSPPTISTFRSRILEKTGMKTNAELVSYALRNHLV